MTVIPWDGEKFSVITAILVIRW